MSSEKNYINDNYKSFFEDSLSKKDPDLYKAIKDELIRQQQHIELIASENIVSQAVLEAQGSVLTNKYAEGYPGKRYYNGCDHVDVAENLAIERLKKLFNCKYEKNGKDCFFLCAKCAFEFSKILKKTFKSKSGKYVSIGLLKSKKEVFFIPN